MKSPTMYQNIDEAEFYMTYDPIKRSDQVDEAKRIVLRFDRSTQKDGFLVNVSIAWGHDTLYLIALNICSN